MGLRREAARSGGQDPAPGRWVLWLGSVRVRMMLLSSGLLLAALVASVATTGWILERRVDDRIAADMQREAEEFSALAGGVDPATGEGFGDDVERVFRVFLQRNVPAENEEFITYLDGEPFLRSGGEPPVRLDRMPELTSRWANVGAIERGEVSVAGVGTVAYQATPVAVEGDTAGVFVSAWFRDIEAAEVDQVVTAAALLGLVLLLLSGGVVWHITGRVLRPVDEAAATARSITETDLSRRITSGSADEIGRLVGTFNDLLDRLEQAFNSQRAFVDDAGHELRTPVTVIRGNLDLLHYGDETQRAAALDRVNDELDRIQRMVDDLLLLAKAQQPRSIDAAPVDLDTLTTESYEKATVLGERDWRLDEVAVGVIVGDRHHLTQAVLQLAQNAVQHTAPGDRISIGSAIDGDLVRVWVADSGPGVDPRDAERIFARFGRGGDPQVDHHGPGLGLAIIDAIARAHHGRVELSNPPEGGAMFTLVLPVDAPNEPGGVLPAHRETV